MPLKEEDDFDIPAWGHHLRGMLEELDEIENPSKKKLADLLSQTLDIVMEMIQRMVIMDYDLKVFNKTLSGIKGLEELSKGLKETQESAQNETPFEDISLSLFS